MVKNFIANGIVFLCGDELKRFLKIKAVAFCCLLLLSFCLGGCDLAKLISDSIMTESYEIEATADTLPPISEISSEHTLFGYERLTSDTSKQIYTLFEESKDEFKRTYRLPSDIPLRLISEACDAFVNDHPELFWLRGNFTYSKDSEFTQIDLMFSMRSWEALERKEEFDAVVDKIVNNAPKNASALEIEIYINDYLVDNCEYDEESAKSDLTSGNANDAYGALVEKKAVCEGYARAFSLLCNRFGIENTIVVGNGIEEDGTIGEGHAWNCVKLGEDWYQVDVTWNDNENDERKDIARYIYLNLDDKRMAKSHKVGRLYSEVSDEEFENSEENKEGRILNRFVPECNSMKYNYFHSVATKFSSFDDESKVVSAIAQTAKKGEKYFYLAIDEKLDFADINRQLCDKYIGDWAYDANLKNFYNPTIDDQIYITSFELVNVIILEMEYK